MKRPTKAKLQAVRADLIAKCDAGQWEGKGLEEPYAAVIAFLDQKIEKAK